MTHGASTEEKRNGQRAGLKRLGLVLHLQQLGAQVGRRPLCHDGHVLLLRRLLLSGEPRVRIFLEVLRPAHAAEDMRRLGHVFVSRGRVAWSGHVVGSRGEVTWPGHVVESRRRVSR